MTLSGAHLRSRFTSDLSENLILSSAEQSAYARRVGGTWGARILGRVSYPYCLVAVPGAVLHPSVPAVMSGGLTLPCVTVTLGRRDLLCPPSGASLAAEQPEQ